MVTGVHNLHLKPAEFDLPRVGAVEVQIAWDVPFEALMEKEELWYYIAYRIRHAIETYPNVTVEAVGYECKLGLEYIRDTIDPERVLIRTSFWGVLHVWESTRKLCKAQCERTGQIYPEPSCVVFNDGYGGTAKLDI